MIKTLYLCIVFFMVLDLRLTKIGTQRSPFFIFTPSRSTVSGVIPHIRTISALLTAICTIHTLVPSVLARHLLWTQLTPIHKLFIAREQTRRMGLSGQGTNLPTSQPLGLLFWGIRLPFGLQLVEQSYPFPFSLVPSSCS